MVHKTRDTTETRLHVVETDEPVSANGMHSTVAALPSTHPDPERERYLDALLERAWPRIKTSMFFLRDR